MMDPFKGDRSVTNSCVGLEPTERDCRDLRLGPP
jgi:hypothetical protein